VTTGTGSSFRRLALRLSAARKWVRRARTRRRLRAVNERRVERALARPVPPLPPRELGLVVPTSYGAPRTLLFVTVKRDNTSWRQLYGHWWLEVDAQESYGWWPRTVPLRTRDLLRGTRGVLNGIGLMGMQGSWYRDPNHGQGAMHEFHPVLDIITSDGEVRERIRRFAHGYDTRWRWHWRVDRSAGTCRSFQDELFDAVGLAEGRDQLHTRGSGCPFLFPLRRAWWPLLDRLARPA
jgi:hypothetical protein